MKSKLREKYTLLRNSLSAEEIEEKSLEIANKLLTMDIWDHDFYHVFLSIVEKKEIDTEPILHILLGKDRNVVISKSNFSTREMQNFLLTDNTVIKKNKWNIPEPVDGLEVPSSRIDVVFVPLLAFDRSGHRVGYGKGFYDIFLAGCKPGVLKIGLSLFEPEDEIPGVLSSDIPMDLCVTPNDIYDFKIL